MKTECNRTEFIFQVLGNRKVVARSDGGTISSDGGGLLVREAEHVVNVIGRFAGCFTDYCDPGRIEHTVKELVSQRVYGLTLGYEDLNDHDALRCDPLLAVLTDKPDPTGSRRRLARDKGKALAGKSTLNRMELTPSDAGSGSRYKKIVVDFDKADNLLVEVFLEAYEEAPESIVLDLDATDDPVYGDQEGKFFHGYYRSYCYLPLYIFCEGHLLCARLRPSNIDASCGVLEEIKRIIGRIRHDWPKVKMILRGDSGFCREEIMGWCETNEVGYVFGLAKNNRLNHEITGELVRAKEEYEKTGKGSRGYKDFCYQTLKSWSQSRRVISKAEYFSKGPNPRFVVTSLTEGISAVDIYEGLYCARGDMENRIKEQQLCLFADRTSTATMRANQIRLYFSSIAYTLIHALRRIGLRATEMAKAQCDTIRLKLLKIGAQIRVTVRHVWVSLSEGYPYLPIFARAYDNLVQSRLRC